MFMPVFIFKTNQTYQPFNVYVYKNLSTYEMLTGFLRLKLTRLAYVLCVSVNSPVLILRRFTGYGVGERLF